MESRDSDRIMTYRVAGRDFTGPMSETWPRVQAFAEGILWLGPPDLSEVRVFLIGKGCLPIRVDTVRAIGTYD